MSKKWMSRTGVALLLGSMIISYWWFDLGQYLSLENMKAHQGVLNDLYRESPVLWAGLFCILYIFTTALSIPGATVLALFGGAIFGLGLGTVLVSFSSTIGATLAFLASRFLFRSFIQTKFKEKLSYINQGIERDGALFLFTLRLVPLFPFFLINLFMGLTQIGTGTFFFVSQLGMLPGTAVYVNAGIQISQIDSLKGILSPDLLFSLMLVGILPLISKWSVGYIRSRRHLLTRIRVRKFKKPSHLV